MTKFGVLNKALCASAVPLLGAGHEPLPRTIGCDGSSCQGEFGLPKPSRLPFFGATPLCPPWGLQPEKQSKGEPVPSHAFQISSS